MKKLKAADFITLTSNFPVKSGTWDFLQDSYNEQIRDVMIASIGPTYSASSVYIIWGCAVTTSSGTSTITEGAVFYNGEIFHVNGNTTPEVGSGLVHVFDLVSTSITGTNYDPVQFTDGTNQNVFIDRKAKLSTKASGSGTLSGGSSSDYNAAILMGGWINVPTSPVLTPPSGGSTFTVTSVSYNRFRIIDRTLFWQCCINNMSISGSATTNLAYMSFPSIINNIIGLPKNLASWHSRFVYKGLPSCYYLENISGTARMTFVTPPNQTYWSIGSAQQWDFDVCLEF